MAAIIAAIKARDDPDGIEAASAAGKAEASKKRRAMLQRSVSTMGVAEREKMREYTKERAKGGSMLEGGKKGGMMEGGKKGGSMMEALDWNSDEGDFNMEEVFLALEDLGHKKTGCRTLLLYLCFVLVFYAVLYFQINPADVFAVQDAIKASVGGIEWSHGNSYKRIDSVGGNPGDTKPQNMFTWVRLLQDMTNSPSEPRRLNVDNYNARKVIYTYPEVMAPSGMSRPSGGFYFRYETNMATTWTKKDAYEAFWSRDTKYINEVVAHTTANAGAKSGEILANYFDFASDKEEAAEYKSLTAQYLALPKAMQSYDVLSAQRNRLVGELKTRLAAHPKYASTASCQSMAADVLVLRGVQAYDLNAPYWPDTIVLGRFDDNAGYVFGNNQVLGGIDLRQRVRVDEACTTPHAEYPVCVAKDTENTQAYPSSGFYNGVSSSFTAANGAQCDKKAIGYYDVDQTSQSANYVSFQLDNAMKVILAGADGYGALTAGTTERGYLYRTVPQFYCQYVFPRMLHGLAAAAVAPSMDVDAAVNLLSPNMISADAKSYVAKMVGKDGTLKSLQKAVYAACLKPSIAGTTGDAALNADIYDAWAWPTTLDLTKVEQDATIADSWAFAGMTAAVVVPTKKARVISKANTKTISESVPYWATPYCYDDGEQLFSFLMESGPYSFPKTASKCMVDMLEQDAWIDYHNKEFDIVFILYNGNSDIYTKVTVQFRSARGGRVYSYILMNSIKIRDHYSTGFDIFRLLLELVVLAAVLLFTWSAIKHIKNEGFWSYMRHGGVINIVGNVFYIINIALWVWICLANSFWKVDKATYFETFDVARANLPRLINQFDRLMLLNSAYAYTNQISMFINIMRVVGYFGFHSRLAVISKTIAKAGGDLKHFFIVFLVLWFLFAFMGHMTIGKRIQAFHTMTWSLQSVALFAFGEFSGFEPIFAYGRMTGVVFFLSTAVFLSLCLCNVLIAILIEGFIEAKDQDMLETESIFETMSAILASWKKHREATKDTKAVQSDQIAPEDVQGGAKRQNSMNHIAGKLKRASSVKHTDDKKSDEPVDLFDEVSKKLDILHAKRSSRSISTSSQAVVASANARAQSTDLDNISEGESKADSLDAEAEFNKLTQMVSSLTRSLDKVMGEVNDNRAKQAVVAEQSEDGSGDFEI